MIAAQPALRVATLLGQAQMAVALPCLTSLIAFSQDPVTLRFHDDGTLRPQDYQRLQDAFGAVEIICRAEADPRVEEWLARHPASRQFRRTNPLALKLFDAVAFAGDELVYCDTDVLFRRPFRGLFGPSVPRPLFLCDRQNAYSLRSWHMLLHPRLRLPRRLNSGIIRFPRARFDLDLVEWYLARDAFAFAPVWREQTCWGLLAWQAGAALVCERQIGIPDSRDPLTSAPEVAVHLVSPVRGLLPAFLASPSWEGTMMAEPVEVAASDGVRCRWSAIVADEFRRARRHRFAMRRADSSSHATGKDRPRLEP